MHLDWIQFPSGPLNHFDPILGDLCDWWDIMIRWEANREWEQNEPSEPAITGLTRMLTWDGTLITTRLPARLGGRKINGGDT
eukprot:9992477-Heterocapsa_arctica.AAC.1